MHRSSSLDLLVNSPALDAPAESALLEVMKSHRFAVLIAVLASTIAVAFVVVSNLYLSAFVRSNPLIEAPNKVSQSPNQTNSNPVISSSQNAIASGISDNVRTLGTLAPADIFSNSSTWPTFTVPEDFYSIQYPNMGSLIVRYSPVPLKTTLGWKGLADFDVSIWTFTPEGLHLLDWLRKAHGLEISTSSENIQTLRVNGMDCVLVFTPTGQSISAYLEQDFFEEPLIHEIDFTSYTHEYTYPPFWKTMLQTFQSLPWQAYLWIPQYSV